MTGVDIVIEMDGCKCVRQNAEVNIIDVDGNLFGAPQRYVHIIDDEGFENSIPFDQINDMHIFFNSGKRSNYDYLDPIEEE